MDCRKCLWLALGLFIFSTGCQNTRPTGSSAVPSSEPRLPLVTQHNANKYAEDDKLPKVQPKPATVVAAGDFFLREAMAPEAPQEKKMENFDKARRSYQQAIKIDPNYLPGQMGLARTYVGMNQLDQARGVYETVLTIAPKNAVAYADMAVVYLRAKNGEQAVKCLGKALEFDPENRQYENMLAWTLALNGRSEESMALFTKLYGQPGAHLRMAKMHRYRNQVEPARKHLETAIALDPQLNEARNLLANLDGAAQPQPTQVTTPTPSPIRPAIYNPPSTPAVIDPVGAEEPQVSLPEAPPSYVLPAELVPLVPVQPEAEELPRPQPVQLLPPPPPAR